MLFDLHQLEPKWSTLIGKFYDVQKKFRDVSMHTSIEIAAASLAIQRGERADGEPF